MILFHAIITSHSHTLSPLLTHPNHISYRHINFPSLPLTHTLFLTDYPRTPSFSSPLFLSPHLLSLLLTHPIYIPYHPINTPHLHPPSPVNCFLTDYPRTPRFSALLFLSRHPLSLLLTHPIYIPYHPINTPHLHPPSPVNCFLTDYPRTPSFSALLSTAALALRGIWISMTWGWAWTTGQTGCLPGERHTHLLDYNPFDYTSLDCTPPPFADTPTSFEYNPFECNLH